MTDADKIPATIITGFLGAGKTTLVRHILAEAKGRRIAVIVNEFGALGIDGETLRSCNIPGCADEDIVELANGCLCCTVADDFLPTMHALLDRPNPPDHIVIETSGLALPKPLLKAFNWPDIRTRVTVDGVIAVVDGPAVIAGRFADDLAAIAVQRASDQAVDHENPLEEVFEDQIQSADLIVLNKMDLLEEHELTRLRAEIGMASGRDAKVLPAHDGKLDLALLLGLDSRAEDDLATRKSHHDAQDGEHEHDDFESFLLELEEIKNIDTFMAQLRQTIEAHDILRVKGFLAVGGKPMRLAVQGVGTRLRQVFDREWSDTAPRQGRLVVIGQKGLNRAAIEAALRPG